VGLRIAADVLAIVVDIAAFLPACRILTNRQLSWAQVAPGAVLAGLAWFTRRLGAPRW
jgi:hypothetical protein